jgi:fucose permease
VAGACGALIVNAHGPLLTDHHRSGGAAAIIEANAFAAGAGLLAPLVIGLAVQIGYGWRAGLLVTVVLFAAVGLVFRTTPVPAGPESAGTTPPGRLPAAYWAAWLVIVLCVAVEFCLTIWSADLLVQRAGLTAGAATAGVTALVGGMTLGRLAGSPLSRRALADRLLLAALAVTAGGFAGFWLARTPAPALCGLLVVGIGVGLLVPLGITRAIAASGGRGDRATARASLGVGLAVGTGPFVLGALADAVGTHRAFLLVPVLLAVAALTVRLSPAPASASVR